MSRCKTRLRCFGGAGAGAGAPPSVGNAISVSPPCARSAARSAWRCASCASCSRSSLSRVSTSSPRRRVRVRVGMMGLALHDGHIECGETGGGLRAAHRTRPHATHSGAYLASACRWPSHRHKRRVVGACMAAAVELGSVESMANAASSCFISSVGGSARRSDAASDSASAAATVLGVTRTGLVSRRCGASPCGNCAATNVSVSAVAWGVVPISSPRCSRSALGVLCVDRYGTICSATVA